MQLSSSRFFALLLLLCSLFYLDVAVARTLSRSSSSRWHPLPSSTIGSRGGETIVQRTRDGGAVEPKEDGGGRASAIALELRGGARGEGKPPSGRVVENLEGSEGLKPREAYHLARKCFHASTVWGFAWAWSLMPAHKGEIYGLDLFSQGMIAIGLFVMAFEVLRLQSAALNKVFKKVFGTVMRQHEMNKFSGVMYCLLGIAVSSAVFPKSVALLGMLQLAIGDPFAALFGHATRPVKWARLGNGKGVLGFAGCTAILTALNLALLTFRADFSLGTDTAMPNLLKASAAVAGLTAMVELIIPSPQKTLPFKNFPLALDDNLLLPIGGALAVYFVFPLFGLPLGDADFAFNPRLYPL